MGKRNKNKRKVKDLSQVETNVNNDKKINDDFKIIIQDENWLRTCSLNSKKFTNKYSDFESMAKTLTKIMTVLIPDIQMYGYDIFNKKGIYYQRQLHCHTVPNEKLDIVKNIIEKLYSYDVDIFRDDQKKIWQYGVTSGERIICMYDQANNIVYPLFVDPFHLIHPDPKHNQNDFMTNKLCPVKVFNESSTS